MAQLKIDRGTTFIITYAHQHDGVASPLTGATVFFTMKISEYDADVSDTTAVASKTLSGASITNPTAGTTTIELQPVDTDLLTPGNYFYDIKVKEADGRIYKMDEGKIKLDGSPTNRLT